MRSRNALLRFGFAGALLYSGAARAQDGASGADVARRSLIDMAAQSAQRGEHALAIEQANRAAQLRNTPSLRFFIAREHLRLGQHVQALAVAGDCVASANADRAAPDRDTMIARCTALVEEAERSVGRLVVSVRGAPPAGLRVTVDDRELLSALYGIAVPYELRTVVVRATASGFEPFSQSIDVVATQTAELSVELRPVPPAVVTPVVEPRPQRRVEPLVLHLRSEAAAPSAGPWVFGALSLAAFGTSIGAGSVAAVSRASRDAACPSAADCDLESAVRSDATYRTGGVVTNVALVTGGALAIGAVTWWIIDRVARRGVVARPAATLSGVAVRW